jgi:hypothetical protein
MAGEGQCARSPLLSMVGRQAATLSHSTIRNTLLQAVTRGASPRVEQSSADRVSGYSCEIEQRATLQRGRASNLINSWMSGGTNSG